MSSRPQLIAYWIDDPDPLGSLGFGVTARSLEEAFAMLRAEGFAIDAATPGMRVREGVTVAELDQGKVVPNMGPIVVRGVWYPNLTFMHARPRVDWQR